MLNNIQSESGSIHPNRLIHEKSPYLLQHAYNPVDWYPWGEEAFKRAKREDKPIFLSVGYSTCHWCHVMERGSFEDPEVAKLMNETFISIKVDREERPDIDSAYMTVCQAMTGSGGWPLTIIMTPDKKPFFAATYIPKETRFGRIGTKKLIPRIGELWRFHREELLGSAERIADELLKQISTASREVILDEKVLDVAYERLSESFDERHGGFGNAPKFPTPHNLTFLLRYWKRTEDERALRMVEKTLESMRLGGLHDHVGFGFHRYSTDSRWLVPHFEKMLYDQAMLTIAYVEGHQATGREAFKQAAQEILIYVLRDMTAPEGGFYSAEDADSEGEEGKFYLWSEEEIRSMLSQEEAEFVIKVFSVEKEGNFKEEATGKKKGRNILHRGEFLTDLASESGILPDELRERLEKARRKLFNFRKKRVRPHRDDKILTDWNGLMIAAMAKVAQVLNRSEYADAAVKASDFILTRMRSSDGRLYHRYRDGEAAIPGFLDDYSFLIWGLIEIYEATFETRYLEKAIELTEDMVEHFWDEKNGGFYFISDDAETVLFRKKEVYDGATPSGNSVAMMNLIRLGHITANSAYREKTAQIGAALSETISRSPSVYTQLLSALEFEFGNPYEIVIVGDPESDNTKEMLQAIRGRFIPNKVVILRPTVPESSKIDLITGYTKHLSSIGGKATAYVCQNYACKRPTTDVKELIESLEVAGKGGYKP